MDVYFCNETHNFFPPRFTSAIKIWTIHTSTVDACFKISWSFKRLFSQTWPPLYPSRKILCFCGPPLYCNYLRYRLQRACVGSWVVYVTGRSGLSNSERLTLSKCNPWEVAEVGKGKGRQIWNSSWSIRLNINPHPRGTCIDLYSHDHANTYLSTTPDASSAFASYFMTVTSAEKRMNKVNVPKYFGKSE